MYKSIIKIAVFGSITFLCAFCSKKHKGIVKICGGMFVEYYDINQQAY